MEKVKNNLGLINVIMVALIQTLTLIASSTNPKWAAYAIPIGSITSIIILAYTAIYQKRRDVRLDKLLNYELPKQIIQIQQTTELNIEAIRFESKYNKCFPNDHYDDIERGYILNKNFTDEELALFYYPEEIREIRKMTDKLYNEYKRVQTIKSQRTRKID